MKKLYGIVLLVLILQACAPRYTKYFAAEKDVMKEELENSPSKTCSLNENYTPDYYTPMRYIRVNFHIMRPDNGAENFTDMQGRQYIHDLLNFCNYLLENNHKMNLPANNTTTVLPIQYRIVLTGNPVSGDDGIYFHNDDTACYFIKAIHKGKFSETDKSCFKYAQGKDSILNIFLLEHFPDSVKNNPHYNVTGSGISYGHLVKIFGAYYNNYTSFQNDDGTSFSKGVWFYAPILNHEIAHSLGLNHTWQMDDGCDDTPKNAGCWAVTGVPPCEAPISNNVMDYNSCQCAYTPCQLSRIHYNFSVENSAQRQLLIQDWCDYHADRRIIIPRDANIEWFAAKDFSGDLEVKEGATLTIHCTISLPAGAKVIVKPGGKLILNGGTVTNRCGDSWLGIELWKSNKVNMTGQVIMANGGWLDHVENFIVEME